MSFASRSGFFSKNFFPKFFIFDCVFDFSRFFFCCVSVHFLLFLLLLAFLFILGFCNGSLHSGKSKATCATVGRDTNQSFRVCEVTHHATPTGLNKYINKKNKARDQQLRDLHVCC